LTGGQAEGEDETLVRIWIELGLEYSPGLTGGQAEGEDETREERGRMNSQQLSP
jgi:hypothetical protein